MCSVKKVDIKALNPLFPTSAPIRTLIIAISIQAFIAIEIKRGKSSQPRILGTNTTKKKTVNRNSGTYPSNTAEKVSKDEWAFRPTFKPLKRAPEVTPVKAFPTGNPIKPSQESQPIGPN